MPETTLDLSNQVSFNRASIGSLALTIGYVLVFYIRSSTRTTEHQKRDDPEVIKERIKVITIYSFFADFIFIPFLLLASHVYDNYIQVLGILRVFGGWKSDETEVAIDTLKALLLVSILFIGPITNYLYFEQQEIRQKLNFNTNVFAILNVLFQNLKINICSVQGLRNFVVGPLTEELVFRSGILSLYLSSNVSKG